MAAPTIVSTYPTSGAVGVPVNATITILFDQEIDLYRLKNGGIIVEGPDQSKSIGPGFIQLKPPNTDEDDLLTSPAYKGQVTVDWAFARVDGSGVEVSYYDYGDTSGAGGIYRTKVTLTPTIQLGALTEYTVYVMGDEDITDAYDFGLSSRSVFDPRKGANLGNGEVVFYGGYTGTVRTEYQIEITAAGVAGTAEYEWWTTADPTHRTLISSIGYRTLSNGVKIKFLAGLNFAVGDTFSVWCDVPIFMDGSSKFSFTTSNQTPTTLPVPSTTAGIVSGSTTSTSTTAFTVSSTNPTDRQALVDIDTVTCTVTFNDDIDAATITDTTVTVAGHPVDESVNAIAYTAVIAKSLAVSGAVLTITLTASQLYVNNLVTITLASSVANTDGVTLGAAYEFFFGTELDPYHAGIRSVRLRLGSIGNYYPDETIAMAIWDASRLADAYAPGAIYNQIAYDEAIRQFTICYAAWLLVSSALTALGGSNRKRLGDFDVSRSEGRNGANGLDDALKECWETYLQVIQSGGDISPADSMIEAQVPLNVVKGDSSYDEPLYGRTWEVPTLVPIGNVKYLYTSSRRWVRGYMGRTKIGS